MKTLYLHCGMHKTGSSFLQTLFVRNRELLKSWKIHYPVSYAEYDMLKGNISPGNGLELSKSLSEDDFQGAFKILQRAFAELKKNSCEAVLFSSESLFHEFGKEGTINRLKRAAKDAGFNQIKALVYFRDPVSHALSTYKHRAKRGDHKDFEQWITQNYETVELLEEFRKYSTKEGIEWSCRKYNKDSQFMAESSFEDWLGLPVPKIPDDDRVNQSLSLSEIRILQMVKEVSPNTVPLLQDKFYRLSGDEKRNSQYLEEIYTKFALTKLKMYAPLFEALNKYLPVNESLIMAESQSHSNRTSNGLVEVESRQMELIIDAVRDTEKSKTISFVISKFWNRGIVKIKRQFKATGLQV